MNKQLTPEQVALLAPYEKHFGTAIRAGYCNYPGEQAIQTMRDVWAELTGTRYPYSAGCGFCLMNLVRDMGNLYYAASGRKPEDTAPSRTIVLNKPAEAAPAAVEAKEAPKPKAAPAKKKSAPKKASNAKK